VSAVGRIAEIGSRVVPGAAQLALQSTCCAGARKRLNLVVRESEASVTRFPDPDASCQSQFIAYLDLSFESRLMIRVHHNRHRVHERVYLDPYPKQLMLRNHV
jgi:hypothetical protein